MQQHLMWMVTIILGGLAIDDRGYIYVGDGVHYELLKFSSDGALVWKTPLQPGPKNRPELGYEITAVAIGPAYQVLVWNRTYERIEIYSEEGKFIRAFPITIHYTGNPSYDSLYVAKNGEVYLCHAAMRDCTQPEMQLGAELKVYSLKGTALRSIHDRQPTDQVTKVDFIGGTKFSLSAVYDPSGGRCITIQRHKKEIFSCLGAPLNRNLHHRFDASGNLFILLDNGVAKIQPDYANAVILKDLPNYQHYSCERKLVLSGMTIERLVNLLYYRKVKNLWQEDQELRSYLLKKNLEEIQLLELTIYARGGYEFKDKKSSQYFRERFPEYKPRTNNAEEAVMGWDSDDLKYLREIKSLLLVGK